MFKFILIAGLVLYSLYHLSKYLMRWAFLFAGKELKKQFEAQQQAAQGYQAASHPSKEDVHIIVPEKRKRRKPFNGGEYVDFEEVRPN